MSRILILAIMAGMTIAGASPGVAGGSGVLQKCSIPGPTAACGNPSSSSRPESGLEITCTDKPVLLGYSQGVCFRATCPGIWALIHRRSDEASFRRRFLTYRHYSFAGRWELKDQGLVETGYGPARELFLVLPDDLIEFKAADSDCNAGIEVRNLGYIKKGDLCELKEWLALNAYMEGVGMDGNSRQAQARPPAPGPMNACGPPLTGGILSLCRWLGIRVH